MKRARLAIVVITAAVLFGACGAITNPPSPPPSPTAALSETAEPIASSPVAKEWHVSVLGPQQQATAELTFLDKTGLVTAVDRTPEGIIGHGSNNLRVARTEQDANVLLVRWGSSPCHLQPTITLDSRDSSQVLTLDMGPGEEDCDAVNIDFGVRVSMAQPVQIASIVAFDRSLGLGSWGLISTGRDGLARRLQLEDASGLVSYVVGADPALLAMPDERVSVRNVSGGAPVLEVAWLGDACHEEFRIDLASPQANRLSVEVTPVAMRGSCGSVPVLLGVFVETLRPVDAAAVKAQFLDR